MLTGQVFNVLDYILSLKKLAFLPAILAEWSKTMVSQIPVRNMVAKILSLNPAQEYNINCSELEITCSYSNSKVPGELCSLMNIYRVAL